MHRIRWASFGLLLLLAGAGPAWADATAFIGANTTPENRAVRGFAAGAGFLVVAFEFEYSATSEDESAGAPSLKMGVGNILLQTPVAIYGFQPYFTTGTGVYRERLGALTRTGLSPNVGGGVKINLAGPLRLRVDYRVLKLGSGALYSPAHRVYAGLNLKF
jgi:opacity protein-like surface antigen